MLDTIIVIIYRIMFIFAGLLLIVAAWEKVLRQFGYTLSWIRYEPSRLLEYAAILFLVVIALLLRQIREALKK